MSAHPEGLLGGFGHEVLKFGFALGVLAVGASVVKSLFGGNKSETKKNG